MKGKVVILAGGFGTRISEYSNVIPKPMIEIGNMPILWHIMKYYSSFGLKEFVILLGYKGNYIREYFLDYRYRSSVLSIDFKSNEVSMKNRVIEDWKVHLVDTGLHTMTGGRINKVKEIVGEDDFFLTYGDGLSDVNIEKTYDSHKSSGKCLTMTAVKPSGRFGRLSFDDAGNVTHFLEKAKKDESWINGGFFICSPKVFDYLSGEENEIFEQAPLMDMASSHQINCYKHNGFWQCMDTLSDKNKLEDIWKSGEAAWKTWS